VGDFVIARWIALGMCWCATAVLAAQQPGAAPAPVAATPSATPPQAATPTFHSGVDLVSLTVTVTDRHERFLSGLSADDFTILEDGVRQPLTFFAAESVPLDLAILIDGSASMREKMAIVTPAAVGLARTLRPQDRAMVVEFRDDVIVRQDLTGDLPAVERAIGTVQPEGGTSLYNAISVALSALTLRRHDTGDVRRQAVVVISDGEDTTSLIDYDDMLDRARRAAVTIYPITLRSPFDELRDRALGRDNGTQASFAMRDVARQTGGQAFFPIALQQLTPIYATIADELGHQYALAYQPQNARRDGAWRHVSVQVPTHPGVQPRTRAGYFAASGARDLLSTLRDLASRARQ
jgi:Ca-activated chloride channel family protein